MKNWRINLVLALIFIFSAVIMYRLFFLQVVSHDFYAALASGQQKLFWDTVGDRGEIFLTNHDLPIATNLEYSFLYLAPAEIPADEKENVAKVLSEKLNIDEEYLMSRVQKNNLYELIQDKMTDEAVFSIEELKLTGVHFKKETIREYPYGDFASHILGFVNEDGAGQYGVEEYWNDVLRGKEEFWEGIKGPLGYFFPGLSNSDNEGENLKLTIDYNIQYFAEKLLRNAEKTLNIEGGTIIVIDPNSGKLLALADLPSFNPSEYSQETDFSIFQSDAIQKVFEPGSVFKPITMAAALDQGKITPETTYQDPGVLEIGGWPIYNYDHRIYPGNITMTQILEKSINTGAVFVENQLGHKKFLEYITDFGIFKKTGVDLSGEISSRNTEFKKGYEINYATASFGQGIEMTPLQLVRAFCVIANGGKLVKPYAVESEPEIGNNNIISPQTASKVTAMLVSVVEGAYTKAAQIPGYYVAGKTGTAQVSYSALGINQKGYSDKTWQSFIGFAPAFNPQFLILVKLNNPATKTAEYSAVPVFQELAKYIIDYYQIPPDHDENK
ncbi:MAG: penicillin-binding protein 2 [Candidatus Nealsonbacteria bacterium]